jgi:ribose 1,5-bisphosphokinase PhnN
MHADIVVDDEFQTRQADAAFGIDWKSNASCGLPTFIVIFNGSSGNSPRDVSVTSVSSRPS